MMIFICIFLLANYFPPTSTALPNLSTVPFKCGSYDGARYEPLKASHCVNLMNTLRHRSWISESGAWGTEEHGKFKVPRLITYWGTCGLQIFENDTTSTASDVFRLSDYLDTMDLVVRACFLGQGGQPGGWFNIGPQELFIIYLGSSPEDSSNSDNGIEDLTGGHNSIQLIGNGTGQVM